MVKKKRFSELNGEEMAKLVTDFQYNRDSSPRAKKAAKMFGGY